MLDPIKMVYVNLFFSALLFTGILLYSKLYPKKKINLLLLLVLVSIIPCISIARNGSYESGDFTIHIYRAMDFYKSLSEGNVFPSWAGALNATYGYPLFIFNYTLPYYLMSFFHLLGFSFIASMKILLASSFILSGVFMYILIKKLCKNEISAFVSSIFYLFAPYHLIDLHFKVVIGEILAFTLLPLLFYFILELYETKKVNYIFLTSLTYALLIMSHVVIALFISIIIPGYIVFLTIRKRSLRVPFRILFAFILGLMISIHVWATPFFLNQYTFLQNLNPGLLPFPSFLSLLYSLWRYGLLFQGNRGEISNLIGYTAIFIVIFSVFQLAKKKVPEKFIGDQKFWLSVFFILIFLLTPLSKPLWETVPFVRYVGQHRLLLLVAFVFSISAGYFTLSNLKRKKFLYVLIFLTIFSTILNWGQRRVIPEITDSTLLSYLPMSTYRGEAHFYANSKWADKKNPWFSNIPKNHIEILKGDGQVTEGRRTSTQHEYVINAKSFLLVQENTLYFPGWRGIANNQTIKLYPNNKGVILAALPAGDYKLYLVYANLPIYNALLIISSLSFLGTMTLLIFNILRKHINPN